MEKTSAVPNIQPWLEFYKEYQNCYGFTTTVYIVHEWVKVNKTGGFF